MAILQNEPTPVESVTPATLNQQPKALTVEEYFKRKQRREEENLTRIPVTAPPKHRRGGKIVRLRKRRADIKSRINADPPPSWERASQLWLELNYVEAQLHKNK